MNAPVAKPATHPLAIDSELATVELELALGFVEFADHDFETALQPALDAGGANLLFVLPAPVMPDSSKVAAISMGSGDERRVLLIVLDADGRTARIEKADADQNPFAPLASSFCRGMERMPPIAA